MNRHKVKAQAQMVSKCKREKSPKLTIVNRGPYKNTKHPPITNKKLKHKYKGQR